MVFFGKKNNGPDLSEYYNKEQSDARFVKLTGEQDITGVKTLKGSGDLLKIRSDNGATPDMYISFNAGNTRTGYIGYPSSRNNTLEIKNQASGGAVSVSGAVVKITDPLELGTSIKAGIGAATVFFTPEDNTTKTLKFYNDSIGADCYFNLDMGNKGQINALKAPTADNQAATKKYVDDKVQTLTVDKANITIKRVNTVEQTADTAGGKYLKFETTNQEIKTFIRNARNAKKVIYFNITYGSNSAQFTDISLFGGENDKLAVAIPPFWSNAEADTFVNKSTISNITIRAIG